MHAHARREKRGRLAPSVTRVVICVSRAFCSTDQEKREIARSLHICKAKRYEAIRSEAKRTISFKQPLVNIG